MWWIEARAYSVKAQKRRNGGELPDHDGETQVPPVAFVLPVRQDVFGVGLGRIDPDGHEESDKGKKRERKDRILRVGDNPGTENVGKRGRNRNSNDKERAMPLLSNVFWIVESNDALDQCSDQEHALCVAGLPGQRRGPSARAHNVSKEVRYGTHPQAHTRRRS